MDIAQTAIMHVGEISEVAPVRRKAQMMAEEAGFDEVRTEKLAIIASEAATNLIKHAGNGEIIIQACNNNENNFIDVISLDKGKGMENIQECLQDGFSTYGSAGTGLGAMQRQSDFFDIYSMVDKGTVIWGRVFKEKTFKPSKFDVGGLSIKMTKESVCGDIWSYFIENGVLYALVTDGLGHGQLAHDASLNAARIFQERQDTNPVIIMQNIHRGLKSTRGAAGAIAILDFEQNNLSFLGVGNIAGVLIGVQDKQLISFNGTLGHSANKFQNMNYAAHEDSILIMSSDGLQTRWSLNDYPGLRRRRPIMIASILYRDFSRGRDDTTIMVVKRGGNE
ncbi:MAG: Anti-sigma regulatory factor (Ser/Thr protein kinase) [Candidatus Nitrotoga sp. SPKER]|nr:MAG: Anti-sigma regulatory factor (Ser/Thr protein kinase) [Candidatus Nitrotoga sp. SPKER]